MGLMALSFIGSLRFLGQRIHCKNLTGAADEWHGLVRSWKVIFDETFNCQIGRLKRVVVVVVVFCCQIYKVSIARSRGSNGLLYTQKKFGWTVTDYTNYQSFWVVHMSVKVLSIFYASEQCIKFQIPVGFQGFIVMPFLCYYLQVHDCMIAILGIFVMAPTFPLLQKFKCLFPRWPQWD